MKLTQRVATTLFVAGLLGSAVAAAPPVDRPTPPPCCADGQCFASPMTYGVYETRWRRWPLEAVQPPTTRDKLTPPPASLQRESPAYELPPAEHEDRRAPAPTAPGAETAPTNGASAPQAGPAVPPQSAAPGMQPRTSPAYPPPVPPQTAPIVPPGSPATQPSDAPLFKSISPDSPLNRSGPSSELDPPPSLPFGPPAVTPQAPLRQASGPATLPVSRPTAQRMPVPSNDPPPAPPVALASYEY